MSPEFSPLSATVGGLLIGLSASLMLLGQGRVAGISGVLGGLLAPAPGELGWRGAFLAGLLAGGGLIMAAQPDAISFGLERSPLAIVAAGLLVGFGTRLGNGCTSGHGVCGLSRFSRRSLVAVMTFMFTGGLSAAAVHHLFGGAL